MSRSICFSKKKSKKKSAETDVWFIGCSHWWDKSKKGSHYFEKLKNDIDPILLGKLFSGETVSNKFYNFYNNFFIIN